jgi:hypothetical protein
MPILAAYVWIGRRGGFNAERSARHALPELLSLEVDMSAKHWLAGSTVLGIAASVVLAIGWYASEQVIHPPEDEGAVSPAVSTESVTFTSRDGIKLAGWFVRGTNGSTVILAHGRGTDHRPMLADAELLSANGFSVLLFDFRYRGESEGDAQTLGAKETWDVESAVDYLKTRSDVDASRIGVHGNSSATSRFSRVSRARYTSPMPPEPMWLVTSYVPSLVPLVSITSSQWARAASIPQTSSGLRSTA